MTRLLAILATTGTLLAHPHEQLSVQASQGIRQSLAGAKKITLSEGLPHPSKQSSLFKTEIDRRDVHTIADFHFYKPAIKPEAALTESLRQLLSDSASLAKWTQKRCGGFHPYWSLNWRAKKGRHHALVCFTCREVIFINAKAHLRYDLTPKALKQFRQLTSKSRLKRPAR